MKKLILGAIAVGILLAVCNAAFCQTYVNGYYRSNGTYVQPHYRSSPNSSQYDNYSTKGNRNPYTGQYGTVIPNNTGSIGIQQTRGYNYGLGQL